MRNGLRDHPLDEWLVVGLPSSCCRTSRSVILLRSPAFKISCIAAKRAASRAVLFFLGLSRLAPSPLLSRLPLLQMRRRFAVATSEVCSAVGAAGKTIRRTPSGRPEPSSACGFSAMGAASSCSCTTMRPVDGLYGLTTMPRRPVKSGRLRSTRTHTFSPSARSAASSTQYPASDSVVLSFVLIDARRSPPDSWRGTPEVA